MYDVDVGSKCENIDLGPKKWKATILGQKVEKSILGQKGANIDFGSKKWKKSILGQKKWKTSILGQKSGKHRIWVKKVENIDFGSISGKHRF